MWKKRILCLVLVLCSILVLSSCQKKETFMTLDQQQQQQQQQQQTASQSSDAQNLFGETALPQQISSGKRRCRSRLLETGTAEIIIRLLKRAETRNSSRT